MQYITRALSLTSYARYPHATPNIISIASYFRFIDAARRGYVFPTRDRTADRAGSPESSRKGTARKWDLTSTLTSRSGNYRNAIPRMSVWIF